jgi:hypothetical protein
MYSFRPELEPTEREAVVIALRRLLADGASQPGAYGSEWRRAALEEGASGDGTDEAGD